MRIVSRTGLAGACVVLGTTVLYLLLIGRQENDSGVAIAPWVAVLTVSGTLAAVAAWVPSPRARRRIYALTAAAMIAVGFLAIFSIGMLLLAAGALLAVAATRASAELRR